MSRLTALVLIAGLAFYLPAQETSVKPVNLAINTDKDEDDPHLSSNGLQLLYASNAGGRWDIMVAERKSVRSPWAAGKPHPNLKSDEADLRDPFLTADGKFPQYLYFASNQDPERKDKKGDNFDLYFLVRQQAALGFGFDNAVISADTKADERNPWLTADRRNLYFSRKEGNDWQLWVASRPSDGGQYLPPVKLDFAPNFHHATLTPDGKAMYLEGSFDGKRSRLFRSSFDGKHWSRPVPLTALNSREAPTGDRSPCLSHDGSILYFVSDRPGGRGGLDIWGVPTSQLK